MSVCPPGGNGTTMRTGLPATGNACAWKANTIETRNANLTAAASGG
jgi:hypothetical protein